MGFHGYRHSPVAPPPREAWQRPVRVEPVPGTPYGLAIFGAPTATAGAAIGALVAGVAAVLVSFLVMCLGLAGAGGGWGAAVAGAFAILAGFLGFVGVGLGTVGMRQTGGRPGAVAPTGGAFVPALPALPPGGPGPGPAGPGAGAPSAGSSGVEDAPAAALRGRGLAVAGLICGATGVGLTLISVAAVLAVQFSGA